MKFIDKWIRLLIMSPHILLISGSVFLIYKQVDGWGWFLTMTCLYVLFCDIKVE